MDNFLQLYNRSYIRIIEDYIKLYHEEEIDLSELQNNLEALVTAVQNGSEEWRSDIMHEVMRLEVIWACMLADRQTSLSESSQEMVTEHIKNIHELIEEYKKAYPSEHWLKECACLDAL